MSSPWVHCIDLRPIDQRTGDAAPVSPPRPRFIGGFNAVLLEELHRLPSDGVAGTPPIASSTPTVVISDEEEEEATSDPEETCATCTSTGGPVADTDAEPCTHCGRHRWVWHGNPHDYKFCTHCGFPFANVASSSEASDTDDEDADHRQRMGRHCRYHLKILKRTMTKSSIATRMAKSAIRQSLFASEGAMRLVAAGANNPANRTLYEAGGEAMECLADALSHAARAADEAAWAAKAAVIAAQAIKDELAP